MRHPPINTSAVGQTNLLRTGHERVNGIVTLGAAMCWIINSGTRISTLSGDYWASAHVDLIRRWMKQHLHDGVCWDSN
jgi:hypothetical protein